MCWYIMVLLNSCLKQWNRKMAVYRLSSVSTKRLAQENFVSGISASIMLKQCRFALNKCGSKCDGNENRSVVVVDWHEYICDRNLAHRYLWHDCMGRKVMMQEYLSQWYLVSKDAPLFGDMNLNR